MKIRAAFWKMIYFIHTPKIENKSQLLRMYGRKSGMKIINIRIKTKDLRAEDLMGIPTIK